MRFSDEELTGVAVEPGRIADDFIRAIAALAPIEQARKIKWRPASRWQAWKDRHAPDWLLRRWPVRHVSDGHLEAPRT